MMNFIWGFMLIAGIIFSVINGRSDEFTETFMSSCSEAVEFIIALSGVMAAWSGLMKIAEDSGLIEKIAHTLNPVMKYLFPEEKNDRTVAMMIMSFMANIFGAGNSATVFSIKAMKLMDEDNGFSKHASNSMCMFTALSMSMLQLVPIAVIKIRSDLGSVSPEDIILPSIVAGILSMAASVMVCRIFERKKFHD